MKAYRDIATEFGDIEANSLKELFDGIRKVIDGLDGDLSDDGLETLEDGLIEHLQNALADTFSVTNIVETAYEQKEE